MHYITNKYYIYIFILYFYCNESILFSKKKIDDNKKLKEQLQRIDVEKFDIKKDESLDELKQLTQLDKNKIYKQNNIIKTLSFLLIICIIIIIIVAIKNKSNINKISEYFQPQNRELENQLDQKDGMIDILRAENEILKKELQQYKDNFDQLVEKKTKDIKKESLEAIDFATQLNKTKSILMEENKKLLQEKKNLLQENEDLKQKT